MGWPSAGEQPHHPDRSGSIAPTTALDLGCGTGDNAIYLAEHGWQVTGVDFVDKALSKARAKASGRTVQFIKADVTQLRSSGIGDSFDLVIDSGCLHGMNDEDRDGYVREVTAVTATGGRLLIVAFVPGSSYGVPGIDPTEVQQRFADGWTALDSGAEVQMDHNGKNPRGTTCSSAPSPGKLSQPECCHPAVDGRLPQVVPWCVGELEAAVLQAAEGDHRAGGLLECRLVAEHQSAEPLAPCEQQVDQPELGERRQLGDDENKVRAVLVVEVEVPLEQLPGGGAGPTTAPLMAGDELLPLVEQGRQDAADQLLARPEVVVERRLGDAEPIGDVLQTGALDAHSERTARERPPGCAAGYPTVAWSRTPSLTHLTEGKLRDVHLPIVK